MSAHAEIAPTAETKVRRASPVRMVIVAVAYLAIVLVRETYPLVSPLNGVLAAEVFHVDRAVDALTAVLWLAVLLVNDRHRPVLAGRQRDGGRAGRAAIAVPRARRVLRRADGRRPALVRVRRYPFALTRAATATSPRR